MHVDGDLRDNMADFFRIVMDDLATDRQYWVLAIRGPEAEVFDHLVNLTPDELLEFLDGLFPGIKVALNQHQNLTDPATILALAALVLAAGAANVGKIIAASVGIALNLALLLGYCNITFSQVQGNADNPMPSYEFAVEKCC
jgi:hypothetical protein